MSESNHDGIKRYGDITKWRTWDIDWSSIDLVIGGSPCQGFSKAGKLLEFDDPRSKLYFVFEDILNHIQNWRKLMGKPPAEFMLENVRMTNYSREVITERLGVKPVFINSDVISPCSRPRYYWASFEITQPKPVDDYYSDHVDYSIEDHYVTSGWYKWWGRNGEWQLAKSYSRMIGPGDKGVCMTARQYSNWTGNFIVTPSGKIRKPSKQELASVMGLPRNYFDCTTLNKAAVMVGNGWEGNTLTHIFKCMVKSQ
ncbi:C-5 cytosine-specific DNA methylase [Vibrio phage 1.055.O._10N.286.55.E9]|nr:C-5 cytosine-specific DNA methylase [Vibrio phage 1.055.O._10N.286.55.E9]